MEKKTIWDLHRDGIDEYRGKRKLPLIIVLDNVRSLNNIGSVFRTSDAFLIECIYLCGITACPPSPEIHKTALGAEDSVAWKYCADTMDAVRELQANGYCVCALEQVKGSVSLEAFDVRHDGKYALVLGHEVDGVSQDVVNAVDCCIELPQYGTKHSLNVSVTAGIAIWQFFLGLRQNF